MLKPARGEVFALPEVNPDNPATLTRLIQLRPDLTRLPDPIPDKVFALTRVSPARNSVSVIVTNPNSPPPPS
jgi:hypothetical protein